MKSTKFIVPFIISTILIKFSMSKLNARDIFAAIAVDLKKIKDFPPPIHCSCHKGDNLKNMIGMKFKDGNKYLISKKPIGKGGTALVFHAIYIGQKWEMPPDTPIKCEAIKVANPSITGNNEEIEKELAIIDDIFKQPKHYSIWPRPDHNLRFFRKEIFPYKKMKHSAIVMELGKQNLYEYWQEAMPQFCRCQSFLPVRFCQKCTYEAISETMLLYIMREISLGLQQLHQRNYIFIDLKPKNVMIMPDSPNPKELNEENLGRLRIKLTDFGSALKFLPENGKRKLSNDERKHLMCTKFYWAPELYDELIDEISPETDIFSLGRLMLMLAVQTPQIKNFWKNLDKNFVEKRENWEELVGNMLVVMEILPTTAMIGQICEFEFESDSDSAGVENKNEIVEHQGKEGKNKMKIEEQEKNVEKNKMNVGHEIEEVENESEIENEEEYLKMLYDELKRNYRYLMEIIERTQATEQEQRPTAFTIVKECSPKLAHLKRNQTELKSGLHSTKSGALISQNPVDATGSSVRRGSSLTRSFKRVISKKFRRLSLGSFKFLEQKSTQHFSNPNSGVLKNRKSTDDTSAGGSVRRGSSLTRNLKRELSKRIRRMSIG